LGEQLVVDYERRHLIAGGRADLAARVVWTASIGRWTGIRRPSYTLAGGIVYIEVKATAYGPETLFYISTAELEFARRSNQYRLYRVFDVLSQPGFFTIDGDISASIGITPANYQARLAPTAPRPDHANLHAS
jgi:hypothetical protein